MYALNGFFLPIICIIWGRSIIYREGLQLIISKLNYISFSVDSFIILVANNVDPDEMPKQYKWFINYIFRKKYLSSHMITVLISYPPKSVILSIYFHNVCMREVKSHIC